MEYSASPAALWKQHARRTTRRINLAWWLQRFIPCAAGVGLVAMGVVIWLRSRGEAWPIGLVACGLAAGYGVTGLGCWLAARAQFSGMPEGLLRIEARMKLNNALSAAAQGVTGWPPVPAQVDDGLCFRGAWLLAPVLLTVASLTFAFLVPLPQDGSTGKLPPPLALSRAESMLTALEAAEVVDSAALVEAREKLNALLAQPAADFYSHHSLEAADALETSLSDAAGNLGTQLQAAAQAAQHLEYNGNRLPPSMRRQLESDLKAAVEGLQHTSMGTSETLQKLLRQLDPAQLRELDPPQARELMAQLKSKAAACKNCQGSGPLPGAGEAELALQDLLDGSPQKGKGDGARAGGEQKGAGRGGPDRGPGTVPLTFGKQAVSPGIGKLEPIISLDPSRSMPGDDLGTRDTRHALDKSATPPTDGGPLIAPAGGGEAVWRHQLMPSEQKVLRRYFK